jgi:hypothetical protein
MIGILDSRTRLGVVAIIVCTFALWLILGAGAELARLIAGAALPASGLRSMRLDFGINPSGAAENA